MSEENNTVENEIIKDTPEEVKVEEAPSENEETKEPVKIEDTAAETADKVSVDSPESTPAAEEAPKKPVKKKSIFWQIIPVMLLGFILGFAVSYMEMFSQGGTAKDIFTIILNIVKDIGIWVFLGALVGFISKKPAHAAVRTMSFFLGITFFYFMYKLFNGGGFNFAAFGKSLILSVASLIVGFTSWYARSEKPVLGGVCLSVPLGIIGANIYYMFESYVIGLNPTIIAGANLLFILLAWLLMPKGLINRVVSLVFAAVIAFVLVQFGVIAYIV